MKGKLQILKTTLLKLLSFDKFLLANLVALLLNGFPLVSSIGMLRNLPDADAVEEEPNVPLPGNSLVRQRNIEEDVNDCTYFVFIQIS